MSVTLTLICTDPLINKSQYGVNTTGTTITLVCPQFPTPSASQNFAYYRALCSQNVTFNLPSGGLDCSRVFLWVTSVGSTYSFTLGGSNIIVPTESTFSNPLVLSPGEKAKIMFEYDSVQNSGQWELTSLIYGY